MASKDAPHNQTKWIILTAVCRWLAWSQGASGEQRDEFQHSVRQEEKLVVLVLCSPAEDQPNECCQSATAVPDWRDCCVDTIGLRLVRNLTNTSFQRVNHRSCNQWYKDCHNCLTKVRGWIKVRGRNKSQNVIKQGGGTRWPLWAVLVTCFPSGKWCDIPQPEAQMCPL